MTPSVTVCLPTYNRSGYLHGALESILKQTLTDFEVIVADNCSTDSTQEVVAGFSDPRIRYVRRDENIGHYRNMNEALAEARGEYVAVVHDDDVYAPEFLAREKAMLDAHPSVGMVHCAVYVVDPERRLLHRHRVARSTRVAKGVDEFMRYLGGHDVSCSTVMCRRDVWRAAGPFQHQYMCGDFLMWLNIALRTDIAYIADPLVETRVHQSSATSTMNPQRWYREFFEIVDIAIASLYERHPEITRPREELLRIGAVQQSKRFLMAAIAAAAEGQADLAREYAGVLDALRARGAPAVYGFAARACLGPLGRPFLVPVREIRRMVARARAA
jgi:glycosyltransferase involved in cell wall biosynthesis